MGFDPITAGVLGVGASLIGGKKASVSTTDPKKQIEPEPQYEYDMRQGLTANANNLLNSGMSMQNIVSQVMPSLAKQTFATQQGLANGQLPQAYQTNFENGIRSGVQNTVGGIVNNLARRGIGMNGTSFTNQLNSVNQAVADAGAKNFNASMSTASGLAAAPMNTASSLSQLGMQQLQVPYNLYGTWRNSRYGNQGQTVVNPGSSPPLAGLGGQLLGSALGL